MIDVNRIRNVQDLIRSAARFLVTSYRLVKYLSGEREDDAGAIVAAIRDSQGFSYVPGGFAAGQYDRASDICLQDF
jgi:hypothetical protein